MTYHFPPDVQQFISRELAGGQRLEEDVLTEALRLLQAEREAATEAAREGFQSIDRGHGMPLSEIDRQLREKHGIASDE